MKTDYLISLESERKELNAMQLAHVVNMKNIPDAILNTHKTLQLYFNKMLASEDFAIPQQLLCELYIWFAPLLLFLCCHNTSHITHHMYSKIDKYYLVLLLFTKNFILIESLLLFCIRKILKM